MVKEKSKIFVRDINSQATLFECELNEAEKAYQFAAQMEELGLEIEVLSPTLSDTLSTSLGLTKDQEEDYRESLKEELEHHEGSCCFEDTDKKIH
jgi:hypothetical protein